MHPVNKHATCRLRGNTRESSSSSQPTPSNFTYESPSYFSAAVLGPEHLLAQMWRFLCHKTAMAKNPSSSSSSSSCMRVPTSVAVSAPPTETKRAYPKNADRWMQSHHRPLDVDYFSPTAGRRVTVIGKYVGGQDNENKSLAVQTTRSNLCTYVFHNRTYVFIMFVRTLT